VRVRRKTSRSGEIARALREGRLIKTWAMRGTLHVLTPEDAGIFLSLLAAGRSWERPSWERWLGITPAQQQTLRGVVREALDGKTLTREELAAAVLRRRGFGHVGDALRESWGGLLKPLAWQGDLCFGPSQGSRVTFMRPEDASSRWAGVPEPDDAAPIAIAAYLRSHGPATVHGFANWLSRGRTSKQQLRRWFDDVRRSSRRSRSAGSARSSSRRISTSSSRPSRRARCGCSRDSTSSSWDPGPRTRT
jgi:hypothetical protein